MEEAPICRFCFEEEMRYNKLLTPCECQGSIRFIHIKCLLKWQRVAPQHFIHKCQLCLTYYRNGIILFECIPNERGFLYQFLICPYLFTFITKYGIFLFSTILTHSETHTLRIIEYFQGGLHLLYFLCFLQTAQVNNTKVYLKHFFKPHRTFVYVSHLIFILYTIQTEGLIFLYLLDIFLPYYWHSHLKSLEEVNDELE